MRRHLLISLVLTSPLSAQSPGMLVSPDWTAQHLDDPAVVILHADTQKDRYLRGHLPGARFLDMNRFVWEGDPAWGTEMRGPADIDDALEAAGVSDGQHIVVYAGNALFAARAWMTLDVMGLGESASLMDGGLGGWRAGGRAVSTDEPTVRRGSVRLHPREDRLVGAEWILARLDDDGVTLVDARPDAEYTGEDGGMAGTSHPGHIPGAYQMYWEELIESREAPFTHDRDELRELFRASGAEDGGTVVAYCMVGWRASYTYFTARLLGYDAKFYDGSWHDWGTRDGYPFVEGR